MIGFLTDYIFVHILIDNRKGILTGTFWSILLKFEGHSPSPAQKSSLRSNPGYGHSGSASSDVQLGQRTCRNTGKGTWSWGVWPVHAWGRPFALLYIHSYDTSSPPQGSIAGKTLLARLHFASLEETGALGLVEAKVRELCFDRQRASQICIIRACMAQTINVLPRLLCENFPSFLQIYLRNGLPFHQGAT